MQKIFSLLVPLFVITLTCSWLNDSLAEDVAKILLVSPKGDGDETTDPSFFLKTFFNVSANYSDAKPVLEVKAVHQFSSEIDTLDQYSVVILNDVPQFSSNEGQKLESYVRAGGCIWIICGLRSSPSSYNQALFRDGKSVLPGKLGEITRMKDGAFDFQSVVDILEQTKIFESVVPVDKAVNISLSKSDDISVWCAYSNGQPAIVEKRFGEGRCILVTTSFDGRWNGLPLDPPFVILVDATARYLVSKSNVKQKQKEVVSENAPESANLPADVVNTVENDDSNPPQIIVAEWPLQPCPPFEPGVCYRYQSCYGLTAPVYRYRVCPPSVRCRPLFRRCRFGVWSR